MTVRGLPPLAFATVVLLGCAGFAAGDGTRAPEDTRPAIAAIHAKKCWSCHMPPEPKSRTRMELDAALGRHKNRVRLTPAQWAIMIDYLTSSDAGP
jgi:hypothetical protein